jgi:tetratricopeptide (TPR) repeat protein
MTRSPVTESVPVGSYTLEVGAYAGSFAQFASAPSKADKAQARKNAAALREALAAADDPRQSHAPLEAVEALEDATQAVTDRVEHANKLFTAVAQKRVDRDLLTGEIGALLGLLERLDREGRYEEQIRVAKALHGLCVLAFRWLDLVRSLRAALAAARAAGDERTHAWALNELGALHLCAGDGTRAVEYLEHALELQQRLGDAASRCVTRHNVDSARRDIARPIQTGPPRRLLTSGGIVGPLVVAGMLALTVLAIFGGFGIAQMAGGAQTHDLVAIIGESPPTLSASATANFSFSAKGAKGFECKLGSRSFKTCHDPTRYRKLTEGKHTFRVRAIANGERGPVARYVWRIDLTPPTTAITGKPPAQAGTTSAAFLFEANEEVTTFQCTLDGDPFTACTSPTNLPGPLADGTHVFAVRAIDLAGNVGAAESYQWTISANGTTDVPAETESTVPRLFGLGEASAIRELEQEGLGHTVLHAPSNRLAEGLVFDQDPEAGTEVARGSTVEITVSTGSGLPDLTVAIPDDGVTVSCPEGAGGCVTTVTFTVTNQGAATITENFEALVVADPDEGRTVTVRGGLPAGASSVRTTELGPGGNCFDPDCIVRVTADPEGTVPELDERNNFAEWTQSG